MYSKGPPQEGQLVIAAGAVGAAFSGFRMTKSPAAWTSSIGISLLSPSFVFKIITMLTGVVPTVKAISSISPITRPLALITFMPTSLSFVRAFSFSCFAFSSFKIDTPLRVFPHTFNKLFYKDYLLKVTQHPSNPF